MTITRMLKPDLTQKERLLVNNIFKINFFSFSLILVKNILLLHRLFNVN
jgi:hypothetical protein